MIQVWVADVPTMDICNRGRLADDLGLSRGEGYILCQPEYLFPAGEGELIHKFDGLAGGRIILDFGFDEDTVAGVVVPDMHAKGLYPYLVCLDQSHRTEDAERLAPL